MKIEGIELNIGDSILVKTPVMRKKYWLFGHLVYTNKLKTEVYKVTARNLSSDASKE